MAAHFCNSSPCPVCASSMTDLPFTIDKVYITGASTSGTPLVVSPSQFVFDPDTGRWSFTSANLTVTYPPGMVPPFAPRPSVPAPEEIAESRKRLIAACEALENDEPKDDETLSKKWEAEVEQAREAILAMVAIEPDLPLGVVVERARKNHARMALTEALSDLLYYGRLDMSADRRLRLAG